MASQGSGRRRTTSKLYSAEDQALNQIAREAEARLAARRQARAEAREIRMRELEKQQKEFDEQSDRHFELLSTNEQAPPVRNPRPVREGRSASYVSGASSYSGSRRSSEDSTEAGDARDYRHQLSDVEDKFRKAMISNAQLDNEKSALTYQVDMLKDEIEEMEENYLQLQREHREKSRAYDQLEREFKKLKDENGRLQENLRQRELLIEEHGLVLVEPDEMVNGDLDEESPRSSPDSLTKPVPRPTLVTQEAAALLEQAGEGTLEHRLKRFAGEKQDLLDEIYRLRLDLEEERQKTAKMEQLTMMHGPQANGPEMKLLEVQREANKLVSDYKFRLKKAEQEISTLQSSVARLETQVMRYRTAADCAEKLEDELKAEKRKLQRELREAQSRIEELETANTHLQKRIDKLKSARNALIKS